MHDRGMGPVQEMGNIEVGQPAPHFTLRDLSGHTVTLKSCLGQTVVLLDFWATWCGPCRMAMPGLQELAHKFQDRGLEILSVNLGDPANRVRQFMDFRNYTFHVLLDQNGKVGNKYGVQALPTLVLVDKQGIVRWIRVGYSANDKDLKQLIAKLLNG